MMPISAHYLLGLLLHLSNILEGHFYADELVLADRYVSFLHQGRNLYYNYFLRKASRRPANSLLRLAVLIQGSRLNQLRKV